MQKELELNPVRYHILIILPQQGSFVHGDSPYNICKVGTVIAQTEFKQLTYHLKLNFWKVYFIEVSWCKEKMVIDFTNIHANNSSHFSDTYDVGKK